MSLRRFLIVGFTLFAPIVSAQVSSKIYGQQLIDEMLIRNPDILVAMMHVTPPLSKNNIVIASNIGRIGKLADKDDSHVMTTGQAILEVSADGQRFEVAQVLRNVTGDTIGELGLVIPYKAGDDQSKIFARAAVLRDNLARRISHEGNLVEPYPFVALMTTKTLAQKILDTALVRHPEILIMAMHVTQETPSENVIIASNIGRIGKKADADDLEVIRTGTPKGEVDATGKRFEVELILADSQSQPVGAVGIVFPYKAGDSQADFLKKANAIVREMAPAIPSAKGLFELMP